MTTADPPWIAAWQAAQRELLEGWPALARSLWETLQGSSAVPPGTPGPGFDPAPADASAGDGAGGTAGADFVPPWAWPALGVTREDQEAWERLLQRVARVSEAQARLAAAWGGILQRSLAALGPQLQERAAAGRPVATLRSLYDLWVEVAEAAYADAAGSSPWVELQAEFANASSELRICQREILERWARQYDLPTRSELDAVHRRTRALEAAVRSLEAALRLPAPKSAKPSKPPQASKRARTAKPVTRATPARTSQAPARRRGPTA